MAPKTAIQWTHTYHPDGTTTPGATWNPIRGTKGKWACVKVSPACAHCYAETLNKRWGGGPPYLPGQDTPRLDDEILMQPLRWKRPRKIFVCSMTDLFWDAVPDRDLCAVFNTMYMAPHHTYLVLTKRPQRAAAFIDGYLAGFQALDARTRLQPHIWIGATVENQVWAERRIPHLLEIPAAVRFVSAEPLLGPLNLTRWLVPNFAADDPRYHTPRGRGVEWVITGGESGGPANRRLIERCTGAHHHFPSGPRPAGCPHCKGTGWKPKDLALEWVRSVRAQCQRTGTAFFHKQWGGPSPKSGGRLLDGREWNEFPTTPKETAHA